MSLKTDWKDDVLDISMSGRRRYNIVRGNETVEQGVSLVDDTSYSQVGDTFGADELNEICEEVNGISSNLTQLEGRVTDLEERVETMEEILSETSITATESSYNLTSGKSLEDYSKLVFLIKYKYSSTADTHYKQVEIYTDILRNTSDYDTRLMREIGYSESVQSREASAWCRYVGETSIALRKKGATFDVNTVTIYGVK